MNEISLNASMRSNLLSLQQISKLQDRTQLRLSTGLKVNSAIDNPSSYYTATALNNRADDLSALLDSMGQGVQTIKAANEGLEKAEDLISQMKAIAEQVNTSGTYVPDKSYFIKEVGDNGAVVSTAEELRQAIADNKETICVYGKIDLGDISTTGGLSLKENQKLVGVNYFGNYKDGEGFSSISATASVANKNLIDIKKTGCLVSDLSLNYENNIAGGNAYVVFISGKDIVADLQNLDITGYYNDGVYKSGISIVSSTVNIKESLNIKTIGSKGVGIDNVSGHLNILSGALINIQTAQKGIFSHTDSIININENSNIYINSMHSLFFEGNNLANIAGNIYIKSTQGGIYNNPWGEGSTTNIAGSAQIFFNTGLSAFYNGFDKGQGYNILSIAQGAKLSFEKDGRTSWYELEKDYKNVNTSTTEYNQITADNVETTLNVAQTSSWKTPADIIAEQEKEEAEKAEKEKKNYEAYQKQFNNALSQYDMLINDSAYKGINLLKEDKLKVNFNEDKSAHILVQGVNVTSENIGLLKADWQTDKDVQTSLDQVLSVRNKLRSAASQLGNYYSIITERQNFTENLINVLTEGADKLTLADMNEESANMLSLQTQQNLAIKSLSLASQASQAVLKLF